MSSSSCAVPIIWLYAEIQKINIVDPAAFSVMGVKVGGHRGKRGMKEETAEDLRELFFPDDCEGVQPFFLPSIFPYSC